jgi:hypothetical protein
MIKTVIDTKGLERQLMSMAKDFGESNEAAVCRWGVHTCRDLVKRTQAFGVGPDARAKQRDAIAKDINSAVFGVSKATYVNGVASGKLSGLVINGELITFTPDRILKTPQEVIDFVDRNRTGRNGRVYQMARMRKGIAPIKAITSAIGIKLRRAGIAKGAWIGAGKVIASKQRKGSKITMGSGIAGYAVKFKDGGTAQLTRSQWNPIGKIINNVPYVSTEYVLKNRDAIKAINEGGQTMKSWYQAVMAARLKRKRK